MLSPRVRVFYAVLTLAASSVGAFAVATPASAAVPGQVAITEWMYNPISSGSEFVEVTNIGGEPVDMTNYSFDDNSRAPGSFSLAALGTLAPGESGLIVETTAAAFRTEWGLDGNVKIAAGNTNNLGRGDEVNIFNGTTPADRLTYGDDSRSRLDPHPRHLGRSHDVCPARREQRPSVGAVGDR